MSLMMRRAWLYVMACTLLASACASESHNPNLLPNTDYALFESSVYPVLLNDCAFVAACHGGTHRFFQVFGPGRTRLDPATAYGDPVTPAEVMHSYERARSMLSDTNDVRDSLLLSKPLESSQGGSGHKGVDNFGRNVYASAQDPRYVAILQWAQKQAASVQSAGSAGAGP